MSDRALTAEAVLAGLQDIRLPAEAPGGLLAELLAALGLGLLLAFLLGAALRLFSVAWQTGQKPPSLDQKLRAAAALPEDQRRLALMHLLKAKRPEIFAELAQELYREGGLPESNVLEAELIRHV